MKREKIPKPSKDSSRLPKKSVEMSQDLKLSLLYEIYKDDIEAYYFNLEQEKNYEQKI